jgi:hypothetical protein
MWRGAVFVFLLAAGVYGQAPVSSYHDLINRLFGDDRVAIWGADASIVLRVSRPSSSDLRIVVLTDGKTTSVSGAETLECIECALEIAAKGPEALSKEYLRLASIAPRRANRQLASAVSTALFEEGVKVIAARLQATQNARARFSRTGEATIIFHPPCYEIELESGHERVTTRFYAVDFDDKKFPSGRYGAIDLVRKLVAASGLRPSN